jgi:hypothetical protein
MLSSSPKCNQVMKLLSLWILLVSVLAFSSCKKEEDPKPSSAEGKWTYTTPDGKMKVEFELVKTTDGLSVQNSKLTVDGTLAQTVTIPDNVATPTFTTLRFSANDAKLIYGYYILFTNGTISSDFSQIQVTSAEYTFPWGTTKKLSAIVIVRA